MNNSTAQATKETNKPLVDEGNLILKLASIMDLERDLSSERKNDMETKEVAV